MAASRLIAVDSGARSGYAYFSGGVLRGARLVSIEDDFGTSDADAVVEIPDRVKVDPKSIIKLALNAGRWLEKLGMACSGEVRAVEASAWKASVNPDILAQRILEFLTPEEIAVIPKTRSALGFDHNVIDAVGLGLWTLGRMGRGGRKIR